MPSPQGGKGGEFAKEGNSCSVFRKAEPLLPSSNETALARLQTYISEHLLHLKKVTIHRHVHLQASGT